jgi:hypothetical protein
VEKELIREGIRENEIKKILGPVMDNLNIITMSTVEQSHNVNGTISPTIEVNPHITINWSPDFSQFPAPGLPQNWTPQMQSEYAISSSHSNSSGNRLSGAGTTDGGKATWINCVDEANGGNYNTLCSHFPSA